MHRYFIHLAYDGGSYHGWQAQPNAITVQQVVQEKLSVTFGQPVEVVGCGRTDTGVHARDYYAHFDLSEPIEHLDKVIHKLGTFFPGDIAVKGLIPVVPEAHARFDATSRTYQYWISRKKDPFLRAYSHFVHGDLDLDAMNDGAKLLLDHSDFASFSKAHTDVKTTLCTVSEAVWHVEDQTLIFTITADRFLRNMVRAIVGSLIDVGQNKTNANALKLVIEAKKRDLAGASAPAAGLYLHKVSYPASVFIQAGGAE